VKIIPAISLFNNEIAGIIMNWVKRKIKAEIAQLLSFPEKRNRNKVGKG